MRKRSWLLCLPVVAAGPFIAGMAAGATGADRLSGIGGYAGAPTPAPPQAGDPGKPKREHAAPLALRLDDGRDAPTAPALSAAAPEIPAAESEAPRPRPRKKPVEQARAASDKRPQSGAETRDSSDRQRPLNLEISADGDDEDTDGAGAGVLARDDMAAGNADEKKPAKAPFDFGDPAGASAPKVKSYNLFNPAYGLHGFMKQGWINPKFAISGGLGLNDNKRIESQGNDLSDDIAVGMGLIMAF